MDKVIYTIGHSNHSSETFIKLLCQQGIDILVDVRSNPASKWSPYTTPHSLKQILKAVDIQYIYLGDILGGRTTEPDCLDAQTGKPDYKAMQSKKYFVQGISQLLENLDKFRICLMCSEEDPSSCHRNLLIGDSLRQKGVQLLHIRGNGETQTDEDLWKAKAKVESNQLTLHL